MKDKEEILCKKCKVKMKKIDRAPFQYSNLLSSTSAPILDSPYDGTSIVTITTPPHDYSSPSSASPHDYNEEEIDGFEMNIVEYECPKCGSIEQREE